MGLESPTVADLAVADSLLNDSSILDGWTKGLLPFEKKKLRVEGIYKKHPYLIQSAIDYELCSRADIFVGNSFSTFSILIVLDSTQRMIRMGITDHAASMFDGHLMHIIYQGNQMVLRNG
ncbi:hypothetical protein F3Y22_tig00000773pilonHSYRG00234 [Hibiscus syriacus]|uniref:Uncharacterized protein n=1 Tax=Hibiscus syriacus TaxID=106335 RepID=A0A6A3D4Q6_HIBSY|nr:hypothetical protein F3Y22_tig00000773pilonHSYRG00234 [Hibiscus syriacus]